MFLWYEGSKAKTTIEGDILKKGGAAYSNIQAEKMAYSRGANLGERLKRTIMLFLMIVWLCIGNFESKDITW